MVSGGNGVNEEILAEILADGLALTRLRGET
jgi:hypothetical protein